MILLPPFDYCYSFFFFNVLFTNEMRFTGLWIRKWCWLLQLLSRFTVLPLKNDFHFTSSNVKKIAGLARKELLLRVLFEKKNTFGLQCENALTMRILWFVAGHIDFASWLQCAVVETRYAILQWTLNDFYLNTTIFYLNAAFVYLKETYLKLYETTQMTETNCKIMKQ